MEVRFADLTRDEQETYTGGIHLEQAIRKNIIDVIDRKNFILGDYVSDFEEDFAKFCNTRYCIGVDSGLSALELSLRALDVGKGDEVITVANTFNATVAAICNVNAVPKLVDVNPETFNMDLSKIEKAITKRTKAIMPVHLYGQSVDIGGLMALAKEYGLYIIEDACQSHGATFHGRRVGSFGDCAAFSFYPGKNLGAYGDGGAITTNNKDIADFLRKARNYGQERKHHHELVAGNHRLDTIQAAVLSAKLDVLDLWNESRRKNAELYREALQDIPEIALPTERAEGEHVYHLFVIKALERDKLEESLKKEGVDTGKHYPVPIHLQPCFSSLGYKQGDFPVSERLSKEILSLPMFPTLKKKEIKYVADRIKKFY